MKKSSLSTAHSSSHASTHLPTCTLYGQTSDTDLMVHRRIHVLHGVWCSECRREYGAGDLTDPHVAQCRESVYLFHKVFAQFASDPKHSLVNHVVPRAEPPAACAEFHECVSVWSLSSLFHRRCPRSMPSGLSSVIPSSISPRFLLSKVCSLPANPHCRGVVWCASSSQGE